MIVNFHSMITLLETKKNIIKLLFVSGTDGNN